MKLISREISWLSFNERVLQEAGDETVPLLERLRFLGIFSSNLDEFFRVRVATLQRMAVLGKKAKKLIHENPKKIMEEIHDIVIRQQEKFEVIYGKLIEELRRKEIHILNETQLNEAQSEFVRNYFHQQVRGALVPIMIDDLHEFPYLRDRSIYLAVKLFDQQKKLKTRYALIEVPSEVVSRFLVLPEKDGKKYVMLLDDVIRFCLQDIFYMFPHTHSKAYTVKLTRDAELDMDFDLTQSLIEKISKGLKERKRGKPVRFIYDQQIDPDILQYLVKRMHLTKSADSLIPGGRYHNFKDFMNFPILGKSGMVYEPATPLPHKDLPQNKSLLQKIAEKDILLHLPYHSFDHVVDLLREAAIDPKVESIKITIYRLAPRSKIINALVNAIRNGKQVTVIIELQARFDEEANIQWSNRLKEEGAKIIFGVQGLKVHGKMILIRRREGGKSKLYAALSTGNFNETTSRFYTDHCLFTADRRLVTEVDRLFYFFENSYKPMEFQHLLVAPHNMRKNLVKLIHQEISFARKGHPASISVKLNNFVDHEIVHEIMQAARAGVKVRMIVRSTCALLPDASDEKMDIRIISIVDKYLEHSRFFIFENGQDKIYLSSADWMMRNLNSRVEMAFPIFSKELREELRNYFQIQFSDNQKARMLNVGSENTYQKGDSSKKVRSQVEIYSMLKKIHL